MIVLDILLTYQTALTSHHLAFKDGYINSGVSHVEEFAHILDMTMSYGALQYNYALLLDRDPSHLLYPTQ